MDAETAFTLFCGIAPMSTGVKNPSHSIRAVVENSPRSHRTNAGYSRDFAQGMWVEATEFRQDFPHVPATNVITMQKKKNGANMYNFRAEETDGTVLGS